MTDTDEPTIEVNSPAEEQPTFHEVFVRGLPGINVEAVAIIFGILDDVERKPDGNLKINAFLKNEKHTSFCITFKDAERARVLVEKYDNQMVLDRKLSVKPSKAATNHSADAKKIERNLIVENIVFFKGMSTSTTDEEVRKLFEEGGKIKLVRIYKNEDGSLQDSGTVSFFDSKSAKICVERFNGKTLENCTTSLRVEIFKAVKSDKKFTEKKDKKVNVKQKTIENCVFFTGLPLTTSNEELREMLAVCGQIKKALIYKGSNGVSQGKGTVSFDLPASATSCIQQFNGKQLGNSPTLFHVQLYQAPVKEDKKEEKKTPKPVVERQIVDNVVYFSGLPSTSTEVELQEMLEVCGSIKRVQIYKNEDGSSKGKGTVSFELPASATSCIQEFNGKQLGNSPTLFHVKLYQAFVKENKKEEKKTPKPVVERQIVDNVVYVSGLPSTSTEVELQEMLEVCGSIKRVQIYKNEDGSSKGQGTVSYDEAISATDCIKRFNKKTMANNSTKFLVRHYRAAKNDNEDKDNVLKVIVEKQVVQNVVHVHGLAFSTTEDELRKVMSTCGKIKRVQIYKREDGSSKGEGTVSFIEPIFATRCIEQFNDHELDISRFPLRLELFRAPNVRRNRGKNDRKGGEKIAYECVICFDTWDSSDMMGCVPIGLTETDKEAHFACLDCIAGHAKALCTDGTLAEGGCGLPCAVPECKRVLLRAPVLRLIDRTTVKQLAKRMDTVAMLDIEGFEKCKRCHFGAIIDTPFEQMQFFICQTPWCKLQFCRRCKVDSRRHLGKSCDEVKNRHVKRKTVEEALSEAVIRKCGKCQTPYQKTDGCNKMICSNCKTTQCYVCQKSGIDYEHFSEDTECKLFGDAEEIDRKRMEEIQREAQYTVRTKMDAHVPRRTTLLTGRGRHFGGGRGVHMFGGVRNLIQRRVPRENFPRRYDDDREDIYNVYAPGW